MQPKLLRKTSATLIDNEFPGLGDVFLGHSPRSIKERHYVQPSQEKFDEAIAWLGERLGIDQP
ncbi:hypothetical protein Pan216_32510 [Planctomycetes bacterium Pan216]|uniref:Uncharacterized protein n=2 Tax=Kolteria novifilia TaxID=2527975 RepID=A0A518B5Y4_9BACT|nr:hypothetical protein Pan216_32510 [Planctomycetes bacterium Pan216]